MTYAAYLRTTSAMAAAVGGELISLAGGCYGVALPVDGAILVLARCPDLGAAVNYGTWAAWLEDDDGEMIRGGDDSCGLDIGFIRPCDYASSPILALRELMVRGTAWRQPPTA